MQRVLFISNKQQTIAPWQQELLRAGYPVDHCRDDPEALGEAVSPRPPEIIVLDGTDVQLTPQALSELMEQHCASHEYTLIWLIREDHVRNLDPTAGVDDFLVLPSSTSELLARIRMVLWRNHQIDGSDVIVAGQLVIDQANYSVSLNKQPLELTFKEYELLRFLVTHRGRVFTREMLLNQVWGYDYYGGMRTVDVHIRRIRAKLGPEHERLVETIRNVGYRFSVS